ncbi:MAG: [Clostridia bacterium]|nr:[citrate (pro-3S)-lyase] ligase [Clostridia bacterium]
MYMITGAPFEGSMLCQVQLFLKSCGLDYDASIAFTAALMEEDQIVATGSLDGNTVKCVAVAPSHQGEDLTSRIMTVLVQRASENGVRHLMLYTKPQNRFLFMPLGFHPVIATADCLLMENKRDGLKQFLSAIPKPQGAGDRVGCIVAHCNPFTLGHRYLIETAAKQCGWVHVFVLSEDKGMFSPEERMQMVKDGCADLKNVLIHPTGPYMVSSATFPDYFIKDKGRVEDIRCEMDIRLFAEHIAPALGITCRYVGTEPNCPVTAGYNARMKKMLPRSGIELMEIPRKESKGAPVSASRVRDLIAAKNISQLEELLPPSTLKLIRSKEGESSCPIPSECRET